MKDNIDEVRKYERFDTDFDGILLVNKVIAKKKRVDRVLCTIQNISQSGVMLELNEPYYFAEFMDITYQLEIPKKKFFKEMEIARIVNNYLVAFTFINPEKDS